MQSRCRQNLNGESGCKVQIDFLTVHPMEDVVVFPEKGRTQALVMSNCSSIKSIKAFPCKQGFLFYELLDRKKRMELVKWKGTPLGGMFRMLCCFFSLVLRAANSFKDMFMLGDHLLLCRGWKSVPLALPTNSIAVISLLSAVGKWITWNEISSCL